MPKARRGDTAGRDRRGVTSASALHPSPSPTRGRDRSAPAYGALVRAAAAGDQAAMEELLMRAQEVAYRFSVLVCGHTDDAEDVMQEALIKTYRHAARIRDPEAFRPWLYRTVRNACLMSRRRRVDEPRTFVALDDPMPRGADGRSLEVPDRGRSPEAVVVNTRLRQKLRRALGTLPAPYRAVVVLREVEGLTTKETAGVLGLSEANVKQRLHRARVALQASLGDL